MVWAGNKDRRLLLVNHTTKAIHHHHYHQILKYQDGVSWDIANSLMSRWGSSALAVCLSSDGVTTKGLVVIQP